LDSQYATGSPQKAAAGEKADWHLRRSTGRKPDAGIMEMGPVRRLAVPTMRRPRQIAAVGLRITSGIGR